MPVKPAVLWVEDSARFELRNLVGPVYTSGKYVFDLAEDVTAAIDHLQARRFDALIVDVRLPPGMNPAWKKLYQQKNSKAQAKLGLKFLYWLLAKDGAICPETPPQWIRSEQIGVFTVEPQNEIRSDLEILGIKAFKQKVAGLSDMILLEIIEGLLNHRATP